MNLTEDSGLEDLQRLAEKMYSKVRATHLQLNLPFAGTPLEDGSLPQTGNGAILLPSPTEMQDLGNLISLVLSSWTQSGKMPAVAQLHSSAESSEVDQVVYIITLYCTGMLGAFLASICSGDLATVSSTLTLMTQVEAQQPTSPITLSRRTLRPLNGPSTPEIPAEESAEKATGTPSRAAPATRSTKKAPSTTKKRSRKSRGRKRISKKSR